MAHSKLPLDWGADIEAKDKDNKTPLHLAACNRHVEVVKLLLDRGVDIEANDKDNSIALHYAACNYELHASVSRDQGSNLVAAMQRTTINTGVSTSRGR